MTAAHLVETKATRPIAKVLALVLLDATMLTFSCWLAFAIRFDFEIPPAFGQLIPVFLVIAVPARLFAYALFGMYQANLRFFGFRDLWALAKASTVVNIGVVAYGIWGMRLWGHDGRVPLATLAIDVMLSTGLIGALRLSKRFYIEMISIRQPSKFNTKPRALVIGAGDAADQLLRHLNRTRAPFQVVGLLDDDPGKVGTRLQGIRVMGGLNSLQRVASKTPVDAVLVAIPSASQDVLRAVYTSAKIANIETVRVLSSSLVSGNEHFELDVKDFHELSIEELLRREPVVIDTDLIADSIKGARVLITGASGSIGSEIVRQVCGYGPEAVRCIDIDETGLFNLDRMLAGAEVRPTMEICDVRNKNRLERVFRSFRPTIVYHAAAYKHVPLMEDFPEEAVATNVRGTYNVATLASQYDVDRFIFISTDKAVNPANVMGASKRAAGRVVCSLQKDSRTKFMQVRFGNVLGSRGSVIPIFLDQLRHGGPLTVTHADIERYFMTIPEAVSLVLESGAFGDGGEVFVLDMGEPVKILTLAEDIIRMHGLEPGKDILIEIVGLRPGEKMFEELLTAEEDTSSTMHTKICKANLSPEESNVAPEQMLAAFDEVLRVDDPVLTRTKVVQLLRQWVPDFAPAKDLEVPTKKAQ